jgi:hypothetical protein
VQERRHKLLYINTRSNKCFLLLCEALVECLSVSLCCGIVYAAQVGASSSSICSTYRLAGRTGSSEEG